MWNLLLDVKGLRYNPSVKPAAASSLFKGAYSKREPYFIQHPQKQTIFLPNAVYASPCKKIVGFHGDFL